MVLLEVFPWLQCANVVNGDIGSCQSTGCAEAMAEVVHHQLEIGLGAEADGMAKVWLWLGTGSGLTFSTRPSDGPAELRGFRRSQVSKAGNGVEAATIISHEGIGSSSVEAHADEGSAEGRDFGSHDGCCELGRFVSVAGLAEAEELVESVVFGVDGSCCSWSAAFVGGFAFGLVVAVLGMLSVFSTLLAWQLLRCFSSCRCVRESGRGRDSRLRDQQRMLVVALSFVAQLGHMCRGRNYSLASDVSLLPRMAVIWWVVVSLMGRSRRGWVSPVVSVCSPSCRAAVAATVAHQPPFSHATQRAVVMPPHGSSWWQGCRCAVAVVVVGRRCVPVLRCASGVRPGAAR